MTTTTIRPKLVTMAVAVTAAAALAACGSSSSASDAGAGGSGAPGGADSSGVAHAKAQLAKYSVTEDHYGKVAPVPNVPDLHGKTIWYIPIGSGAPVLETMGTAVTAALGHLGATVKTCDGKFQPTVIAGCMQTAQTQGASAVVTGFVDYAMAPSAFQELASKGIPTLVGGETPPAGLTPPKDLGFFDVSPLTHTAYKLLADAAIADSNGSANVLQVKITDSPTTEGNAQATQDEFTQYCPGCKVDTVGIATAELQDLGSALSAKLSANPDINYVILGGDDQLEAAMPGLQSANFINKVKIIAPGGGTTGLQAVKANQIAYDIGQGAEEQGWAIADAAVRLLAGAPIPPQTRGPVRVFTKDNVGSLDISAANYSTSVWFGSEDWQHDFLNAWAGK